MAEYADEIKAQALAALLAGDRLADVARRFAIPIGTLKSWKLRSTHTPAMDAPDASERRSRIGALLLEYLESNLETLITMHRTVDDAAWIREQGASEIAVLYGAFTDRAVRILEGLADDSADRDSGLDAAAGAADAGVP